MRPLVLALVTLLIVEPIGFAAVQEKAVSWADFRQDVGQLRLTGRRITVNLSTGGRVNSTLRRVEAESLVVESNPNTSKRWPTADGETRIPRAEVEVVKFLGRKGHGGLIGGLVGLGAAVGLVAAASRTDAAGATAAGALIGFPVFGLGGYFIGRTADKPLPQYRILP